MAQVDSRRVPPSARIIGRYMIAGEIASGGMATVHFGRLLGPAGFSRTVAIKRVHRAYVESPEFTTMLLDEARVASRIRHPNVVPTLDVVWTSGELLLVMDYVQGEPLSRLLRASEARRERAPLRVLGAIFAGVLHGLHAAHEATSERGEPLDIVHRDVSPHNVLVGVDGIARVLDFGIAKAVGRVSITREGQVKGKLAYMAPEQLSGDVSRAADIYAVGIVLWEALTQRRLFESDDGADLLAQVLHPCVTAPSRVVDGVPPGLDAIVMRALDPAPDKRFATARQMAVELEECLGVASPKEVGEWVEDLALESLLSREEQLAELEGRSAPDVLRQASGTLRQAVPSRPTVTVDAEAAATAHTVPDIPPPMASAKRPRSWLPLGLAGAVIAALALSAVSAIRREASLAKGARAAVLTDAVAPAASARVAPAPPSEAVSTSDTATATATATDVTTSPARVQVPAATSAAAVVARAPEVRAEATKAPAPRAAAFRAAPSPASCDPPYTRAPDGTKRWKPECF